MAFLIKLTITLLAGIVFLLQKSSAAECSNWEKPVLTADYTPQGNVVFSAGMDTYETGNSSSTKVLIAGTKNKVQLLSSCKF